MCKWETTKEQTKAKWEGTETAFKAKGVQQHKGILKKEIYSYFSHSSFFKLKKPKHQE